MTTRPPTTPYPGAAPADVAPRTRTEQRIAEIWADVLGLGVERIGVQEGFFDLGGHSLAAVQVASRLRHAFGIDVPLGTLFAASTVAALAEEVDRVREAPTAGLVHLPLTTTHDEPTLKPARSIPTSLTQEYRLLFNRAAGDGRTDPAPFLQELRGTLQPSVLQMALDAVVGRHDALRTRFPFASARQALVVATAEQRWPIDQVDLSGLEQDNATSRLEPILKRFATAPFDLDQGPPGRVLLVRLAGDRWVLGVCVDHVVFDGISLNVLFRELSEVYDALLAGRVPSLAPLPYQFADYARAQRSLLDGAAGRGIVAYWSDQFRKWGGYPPESFLPGAINPRRTGAAESLTLVLEDEVVSGLRRRCGQHGASLYMGWLTAVLLALRRSSPGDRLGLTISEAGRQWEGTESVIGCFVHNLQVWAEVPAAADFTEVLGRVRDQTLGAVTHSAPLWHLAARHRPRELTARYFVPRVHFLYQPEESPTLSLRNVTVRRHGFRPAARYYRRPLLRIQVIRSADAWKLVGEFVKGAYDRDAIAGLLADVSSVVARVGGGRRR